MSPYGKFIANCQRFRYICIHIHTNARMHNMQTGTHTHPHKHRHTDTQAQKQDKVQFYLIQLYNAHKFSTSASKFIFSFIVNFVHNSQIFNRVDSSSLKYCKTIELLLDLFSKDSTSYSHVPFFID